jgi:hypothetical protein
MKPLQVALPVFGTSLNARVARDAARVFQDWDGDQTVWCMPSLERPSRWRPSANALPMLAIPAEAFDQVDIYHVDETGSVLGPGAASRFPRGRVDSLLHAWLNIQGGVPFVRAEPAVRLSVPCVRDGRIVMDGSTAVFEEATVPLEPGPMLQIIGVDVGQRTAEVAWPPSGYPPPVSFEAESRERFGRLTATGGGVVVSTTDPTRRALHVECVWPEPLRSLFLTGGGWDSLFTPAKMASIALEESNGAATAALKARATAGPYVAEGDTTVELLHFFPALMRGADVAWGAAERLKLLDKAPDAVARRDLRAAYFSAGWQDDLKRRVSVRRCWGPIGLFWGLLIEELEKDRPRACRRCGRIISGNTAKQFCGRADNVACFRARRAAQRQVELERQRAACSRRPEGQPPAAGSDRDEGRGGESR